MAIRTCENQRYGLIDDHSQILLPCSYHHIGVFKNGLAKIRQKSLWGLVDESGVFAVSIQYDKIKQLACGLIKVKRNGRYGLLDRNGKILIPCEYRIKQLDDRRFAVEKDGLYGLYDISGKKLLPCDYDQIRYWDGYSRDDWFQVRKNGLYGIVDKWGDVIIPCKFHKITSDCYVYDADGHHGRYDFSGNCLYPCEFYCPKIRNGVVSIYREGEKGVFDFETRTFTPNTELGSGYRRIAEKGKWGIVDKDGNTVTACQWDRIADPHYGVFAVKKDGKWGLLDMTPCLYDVILVPPVDSGVRPLWEPFKVKCNGKWGILDLNGEIVIPCIWDDVIWWYFDKFRVRLGTTWQIIDLKDRK